MDSDLLDRSFHLLEQRHVDLRAEIGAIDRWIRGSSLAQRFRINPCALARDAGLDPITATGVLLHGTQAGLFDLHWDIHCGHCHMLNVEIDDLADVSGTAACQMCEISYEVDLSERVEVTFSLTRAIEDLDFPAACLPPSVLNPRYGLVCPRGEAAEATHELPAGRYRYFCPTTRARGVLHVEGEPTDELQTVAVTQLEGPRYDVAQATLRPGRIRFQLRNTGWPICGLWVHTDVLPGELDPASLPPRLTGLALLHVPEYRRYFGKMVLSARERLKVRSITVVFTDLCGSTRLYEEIGDARAYNLVRDHFEILSAAVEEQGGALVKTIGDAVMATFLTPDAALRALDAAMRRLAAENAGRIEEERLSLRAGAHCGPALLVNLNQRLDYFGRTVNRAARMLGTSRGGELTLSAELAGAPASLDALASLGWEEPAARRVDIKGLSGAQMVFTTHPPA